MYQTCPKCGHRRAADDDAPAGQCPACGVLFEKWLKQRLRAARTEPRPQRAAPRAGEVGETLRRLGAVLVHAPPRVNVVEFWVRALVYLGLVAWGLHFIWTDWSAESGPFREIGESFMHRVNLVFHEAGHVIFMPLGEFMSVLGGSLGQLLMPLVVMLAFLFKYHNAFGAVVGLWWLAQSLMDLAPYIGDARRGELLLLGGITGADAPGYHDWSNLLARTGLLQHDRRLAGLVDIGGELLMWVAFVWGALVLYRQYRNLDRRF